MIKRDLIIAVFFVAGCGVKGKPLPPLAPVRAGDGTLKSQRIEQKAAIQKQKILPEPRQQ